MTRPRWVLLAGIVAVSAVLSFMLRDVAYQAIVVPFAYVLWIAGIYYAVIPQFLKWVILLTALCLAVAWNLIPEWRSSPRKARQQARDKGQVESLARWIHRARASNYFKWQLANRLARVGPSPVGTRAGGDALLARSEAVDRYLASGLNNSFVEFPNPRNRFQARIPTPLDIDPTQVVEYLESQMEMSRRRRP